MIENISDLRLFAEIIRTKNISRAAKSMNLSPAVASKRLQRLENALEMQLLHRTTRQVSPTEKGREIYEKSLDILEKLDELGLSVTSISPQTLKSRIRISAPMSFGHKFIVPCISEFLTAYPLMKVDLVLDDMRSDILQQGIDLAITIAPLKNSNFIVKKIADNKKILVAGTGYLKKHGYPQSVQDLSNCNALILGTYKKWTLLHEQTKAEETVTMQSNFTSNNGLATVSAAKANLGICIKSWWDVKEDIQNGALVRVLPEYLLFSDVSINVIYPRKQNLPIKTRVVLDYMTNYLKKTVN